MNAKLLITMITMLFISVSFLFSQETALNQRKPVIIDEDLVIQISEITENALYFPVEIDGILLEIIAVKVHDGTIRTAFNTCMICYQSGKGYFVQVNTLLVCQNCGNRYRMCQVEMESGGCNPEPIFPENKAVTDESITISVDLMREYKYLFDVERQ